jgi:hypothetical protein
MAVISGALGLALPVGFEPDLLLGRPDVVRDHLRAEAVAELLDRRILARGEGPDEVDGSVAAVVRVAAEPGLLLVATVESAGVAETHYFAVNPDLGVEEAPLSSSLHRFTPFPASEVLKRALRFCDLRPHELPDVTSFRLRTSALEAVGQAVLDGQSEEAVGILDGAGVDAATASAFLAVVSGAQRTVSMTVFYRPSDDEVAGGSLTWLDGGLDGLWIAEAVESDGLVGFGEPEDDPLVDLLPSTGHEVARELLAYLPPAFVGPES